MKTQNKRKRPPLIVWYPPTEEGEQEEISRIDNAVMWAERRQTRGRVKLFTNRKISKHEKELLLLGYHIEPEDRGKPVPEDAYEKYHGPESVELDDIAKEIIEERRKPKSQFDKSKMLKLIEKAESLMDPASKRARPGGKARGNQVKEERAPEHAAIREEAANMEPGLSKRKKAEILKKKKKYRHLSTETIRKIL